MISPSKMLHLKGWQGLADLYDNILTNTSLPGVHIALVGKYTDLSDAYLSVTKALQHAALKVERRLVVNWIEASNLEPKTKEVNPEAYENAWSVQTFFCSTKPCRFSRLHMEF